VRMIFPVGLIEVLTCATFLSAQTAHDGKHSPALLPDSKVMAAALSSPSSGPRGCFSQRSTRYGAPASRLEGHAVVRNSNRVQTYPNRTPSDEKYPMIARATAGEG